MWIFAYKQKSEDTNKEQQEWESRSLFYARILNRKMFTYSDINLRKVKINASVFLIYIMMYIKQTLPSIYKLW